MWVLITEPIAAVVVFYNCHCGTPHSGTERTKASKHPTVSGHLSYDKLRNTSIKLPCFSLSFHRLSAHLRTVVVAYCGNKYLYYSAHCDLFFDQTMKAEASLV